MVVLSEFFMFLYDVLYESLWWGKVRVCHLIDSQQSVAAYFLVYYQTLYQGCSN